MNVRLLQSNCFKSHHTVNKPYPIIFSYTPVRFAGHSKWANIRHHKAANDIARGKLFSKLSAQITIAVKKGDGHATVADADPKSNYALASILNKAKEAQMPKDKVEVAINKGLGVLGDGAAVEFYEAVYEAMGPSGACFVLESVTDSKNRTVQELRHGINKRGGSFPATVMYMFEKLGRIDVKLNENQDVDEVMEALIDIDSIQDMVVASSNSSHPQNESSSSSSSLSSSSPSSTGLPLLLHVYCTPNELMHCRKIIESERGFRVNDAELVYLPKDKVTIDKEEDQETAQSLFEFLESREDIVKIHHNLN